MAKKVLFISYDGMCDPLGQSQVIPYLAGLSVLGFQISIISAEKPSAFITESKNIQMLLSRCNIKWKHVEFSNQIPGWSAWSNYLRLKKTALRLFQSESFDLIHCRSYIPAILGLYLREKFGSKVIFDMRGFWSDERVEGNLWQLSNPVYKAAYNFFKKKEIQLLNESDAIVSLTENAKKEMLSWRQLIIPSEKITVIPCCADLNFFSLKNITTQKLTEIKNKLGISEGDFILSYSGSLGTWYMLDEMLQFFKILLQQKPEAKFLFVTHEPPKIILEAALKQGIAAEKIISIAATRDQMPAFLSLSHAAIFFIKNSFSKKASSPTKMGEIMSLGIPLICNTGVGDVQQIVEQSKAGIAIENFTEEAFTNCCNQLDALLTIPKEQIREAAFKYYSLDEGVKKYNHIYSTL